MPTLLCAGQFLCEPIYYASAYLPFLLAIAIPMVLFLMKRKKYAYVSVAALVSSAAVSEGLKYIFNIPRPISSIDYSPSFPSSHATISFSEAHILKFNRILFVLGLAFASFVAFGRVYTGFHTWEDVVAGAVLGYAVSEIVMRMGRTYIK